MQILTNSEKQLFTLTQRLKRQKKQNLDKCIQNLNQSYEEHINELLENKDNSSQERQKSNQKLPLLVKDYYPKKYNYFNSSMTQSLICTQKIDRCQTPEQQKQKVSVKQIAKNVDIDVSTVIQLGIMNLLYLYQLKQRIEKHHPVKQLSSIRNLTLDERDLSKIETSCFNDQKSIENQQIIQKLSKQYKISLNQLKQLEHQEISEQPSLKRQNQRESQNQNQQKIQYIPHLNKYQKKNKIFKTTFITQPSSQQQSLLSALQTEENAQEKKSLTTKQIIESFKKNQEKYTKNMNRHLREQSQDFSERDQSQTMSTIESKQLEPRALLSWRNNNQQKKIKSINFYSPQEKQQTIEQSLKTIHKQRERNFLYLKRYYEQHPQNRPELLTIIKDQQEIKEKGKRAIRLQQNLEKITEKINLTKNPELYNKIKEMQIESPTIDLNLDYSDVDDIRLNSLYQGLAFLNMHQNLQDKVNYMKKFVPNPKRNYFLIKNEKAENDVFINTFATKKKNIIESEAIHDVPDISKCLVIKDKKN